MKRVALIVLSTAIAGAWLFAPSRAAAEHPIFAAMIKARVTHDWAPVMRLVNNDPRSVHARDSHNCTPLHYAETAALARLMIQKGAHVHARCTIDSETPLAMAANAGRVKVVKVLVQHGAMVNETYREGYTPLHRACTRVRTREPDFPARKLQIAAYLLTKGANVNARASSGYTALSLAEMHNWNPPLAALIRRHGGRR